MSEFIVETTGELYATWYPKEEIVRCCDCMRFGDCDWNYEEEPDGYCAWYERRKEADE